jgi:hypothetical protein
MFRACTSSEAGEERVFADGTCWAAVIDIAGEPFKALFDFETDAWAAFKAACPLDGHPERAAGAAMAAQHAGAGGLDAHAQHMGMHDAQFVEDGMDMKGQLHEGLGVHADAQMGLAGQDAHNVLQ